jgi:hypothetical protein
MEPIRKRPAAPVAGPLAGGSNRAVSPLDNWWTLAQETKRCDPWDIIYFNFQTYNPEEVNWYLFERLGCRLKTPDGRNYRFAKTDPPTGFAGTMSLVARSVTDPIQISIPPAGWFPPGRDPEGAKAAILRVLREPFVESMHFALGSEELKAGDMAAVAAKIASGKIKIIHRPCLGHIAQYWNDDRMFVPFTGVLPFGSRALVVHEATHAALDIRSSPANKAQSESIGYVAQALYLREHGLSTANFDVQPGLMDSFLGVGGSPAVLIPNYFGFTTIYQISARIADAIATGSPVDPNDVTALAQAFDVAPMYRQQGNPGYNGVP